MSSQLPLPFGNFEKFNFDVYVPGENSHVVDVLREAGQSDRQANFYLWGNPGTGKSHLLQAICGFHAQKGLTPGFIPLREHLKLSPEIMTGLESLDIVCLDDIDSIAGLVEWERALFNLFNLLMENEKKLFVTASSSPSGNGIVLPDLKSRLASGLTFRLGLLSEEQRLHALKLRAAQRGFELSDDVLEYLSRRIARDMHTLFTWLDRLDKASLVSKRKLTVSLVRTLLENQKS